MSIADEYPNGVRGLADILPAARNPDLGQLNLKSHIDAYVAYAKLVGIVPVLHDTVIELDEPDPTYIHVLVKGVTAFTVTLIDGRWVVDPIESARTALDSMGMPYDRWALVFFGYWHRYHDQYGITVKIHNASYSGAHLDEDIAISIRPIAGGGYFEYQRGKHRTPKDVSANPHCYYELDELIGHKPKGDILSVEPVQLHVTRSNGDMGWRDRQQLGRTMRPQFPILEWPVSAQRQLLVRKPTPVVPRKYSKSVIGITVRFRTHPGYVLTLCELGNPVYKLGMPDCPTRVGSNHTLYAAGAFYVVSKLLGKPYRLRCGSYSDS